MNIALRHLRRFARLFAGPPRVWFFNVGVVLACAAAWSVAISSFSGPALTTHVHLTWWVLALAFYLAEVFVVHLQFRKQAHTLSLTEVGLVLGLFLVSPTTLLVAQALGTFVALAVNRRSSQRPIKLVFNVAELPLCSAIALLVFRSFTSHGDAPWHLWLLALAAAAVAHCIGVLLVSLIIGIAEGRFNAPQLGITLVTSLVGSVASACLGLTAVELFHHDPLSALLLVVPIGACVLAFRGYMAQREQREHVEFLYESMRATQGAPEFGLAVGQLLVAARRMLRAEYAEILLLSPAEHEGPIRSVSGVLGEMLMHPEETFKAGDENALEVAAAKGRGMLLDRRHVDAQLAQFMAERSLDDAIIGPLRGEGAVLGLLIVGDRAGDVSTFNAGDLDLFDTYSGHASILLENGRLEHSLAQVTELKEQLRHQAFHDPLTGLANRLQFVERVAEALAERRGHEVAVLYLDLDRFKSVNDTWGHGAGDELLVHVGRRLGNVVRNGDLAARLGGDEFAVLLMRADRDAAVKAADRVAAALTGAYELSTGLATTHASIGIALSGPAASTADVLVRNADIAMYAAKRSETERWALYESQMHERVRDQRQLAMELEEAISLGGIDVHYQPVVSLGDGRITAFEALARWHHARRGLLTAAEFIPTAEEFGLMIDLGLVVLRQAFATAQEWPNDIGIWVNLAPAELANERLIEELAVALTKSAIEADRVTIEITESSVIRDEEGVLNAMQQLRDLGVHLSIDDFGTGYSSLSRLAEFPIESLKIPKPFVDKLVGDEPDDAFVTAILRMAQSLGLATVAEGIESADQADRLRALGCTLGQGYLISRAVDRDRARELFLREPRPQNVVPLRTSA